MNLGWYSGGRQGCAVETCPEIDTEAYNSAWEQYDDPDGREGDESREATGLQVT